MGQKAKNELGNRYGKVVVVNKTRNTDGTLRWIYKCDCGNSGDASGSNLREGKIWSCGCRKNIKNEIGKRYGHLLVLEYDFKVKNVGAYWKCKCDCGNITSVKGTKLRNGRTKSCGHKVSRIPAASNKVFLGYKHNARRKGLEFSLEFDYFLSMIQQECYYCKSPPSNITYGIAYGGIDRIDNKVGYTIGNVVPCCQICNYAKRDMSVQKFITWISQVFEHSVVNVRRK